MTTTTKSKSAPNVTKNGVEVIVGQVWRDLSKDAGGRLRRVASVVDGQVTMQSLRNGFGLPLTVPVAKMHHHKQGWELVAEAGTLFVAE